MTYLFLWVSPQGEPINETFEAGDLQLAFSYCISHFAQWLDERPNRLRLRSVIDPTPDIAANSFEPRWDNGDFEIWGLADQLEIPL